MPRNNADRKRIALGEKHEVQYLRKLCKKFIKAKIWDSMIRDPVKIKGVSKVKLSYRITWSPISGTSLKRICKALLKVTK